MTDAPTGNLDNLEIISEDDFDENLQLPTYVYLNVWIRGKEIRLGIDTGSVRTLLSEEIFNILNADRAFQLRPHRTQFQAVNGSQINCLGQIQLPVLFRGIDRHYKGTVNFYVIKDLEIPGLLGIDELTRHGFNINLLDGSCYQSKAGEIAASVVYKEDRGVRQVTVAQSVFLPARTTCDIKVRIEGVGPETEGEGMIVPQGDIWSYGISAGRVLILAKPEAVTQVINNSDNTIGLEEGQQFGSFNFTLGAPLLVSSVVEEQQYGKCQLEDEEVSDPMEYEEFEDGKLEAEDFGLSKSNLSEEQKREVRTELSKFKEVFQWDGTPVSFTNTIKHRIPLKPDARPVKQKGRIFSEEQNSFIDSEIEKLIRQDVVQPSTSSWSSRIVLSREERKNRWRLCIDYRTINSLSAAPMAHPLPNIQEVLDQFRDQRFFITLDMYQGYHQIQLEEESRPITAFATRKGLYEYKRMPFGLASCPTTYQAVMQSVLGELVWKGIVVYIDDLIIFGRTYEETRDRLILALQRLKEAGLKLRASKCKLFLPQVEFLGFVVSNEGVKTCEHIVSAIVNFPTPCNVKSTQRLLGIANFYRSFIKNHSKILEPLINLTRKGVAFKWTDDCQTAFETIKNRLVNAPVRHYFDPELMVVLTTDASGRGIGAVLSQVNKEGKLILIAYGSRVLKPAEYGWSTTEKECFAIVYFVKKFRQYLHRPFLVFSDHNSLRYVSTMRDSSRKITRWLNFLMQYEFEVHHREGRSRELIVPDILSRMMLDVKMSDEERQAQMMERPIIRYYEGYSSPILTSWFCVESPQTSDFDESGNLVVENGEVSERRSRERESQLRIMINKMQKESEAVGEEATCRWVSAEEVEYLN